MNPILGTTFLSVILGIVFITYSISIEFETAVTLGMVLITCSLSIEFVTITRSDLESWEIISNMVPWETITSSLLFFLVTCLNRRLSCLFFPYTFFVAFLILDSFEGLVCPLSTSCFIQ